MENILKNLVAGDVTLLLVTIIVGILGYYLFRFLNPKDEWSKYGVAQAKGTSFRSIDFRKVFTNLFGEYGNNVGMVRERLALLTRDLDLIKEVMVKDFNNFVQRGSPLFSNSAVATSLFFADQHHWRRLRHLLSPTFSTGKLKVIGKSVDETARILTAFFEECARTGTLIPLKETTGQYTSQIIAKTAFGLDTSCIGEEDDEFTYNCKRIFKQRTSIYRLGLTLLLRFPEILKFIVMTLKIQFFDAVNMKTDRYLRAVLKRSVEHREQLARDGKKTPADFLQLLVNAKVRPDHGDDLDPDKENSDLQPLSEEELVGQSILIIFAGFETTATTLQMALYLLAKHPDIQEKVLEEIQRVVTSDKPSHEELGQLTYTEQVIDETLRLYPPVPVVTRRALQTKTYGSVTIPAGADVLIALQHILQDPDNFPDPMKFDPDRFSDANKSARHNLAFMAFGHGPRLCIGMRLAYLELKVALVHTLRKVRFELNENTEPKKGVDVVQSSQPLVVIDKPIKLACTLR